MDSMTTKQIVDFLLDDKSENWTYDEAHVIARYLMSKSRNKETA